MQGKLLGIRIPDNIMNKLEMIAQQRNETPNQLGKKALIEWIEVLFSSRNLNMIIFPKEILIQMLSYINNEQVITIASEVGTKIIEYFQFLFSTHLSHFSEEMYYDIICRFLGPSGCMWFDHLEFELGNENNTPKFRGTHKSGKIWSIFIKNVLEIVIKQNFQYEINPESVICGDNTLNFEFSKKKK